MKTHSFGGRRFRISCDKIYGYTDDLAAKTENEIYIDGSLAGTKQHLEVALHEARHAIDPGATEEKVTRESQEQARFLWRLGYRLVKL